MRYGSLPICRRTGGLADTIKPFARGEKNSNGFLFNDPSAKSLWTATKEALEVFANKRKFTGMRKNALSKKCDWEQAAEYYLQTYQVGLGLGLNQVISLIQLVKIIHICGTGVYNFLPFC